MPALAVALESLADVMPGRRCWHQLDLNFASVPSQNKVACVPKVVMASQLCPRQHLQGRLRPSPAIELLFCALVLPLCLCSLSVCSCAGLMLGSRRTDKPQISAASQHNTALPATDSLADCC